METLQHGPTNAHFTFSHSDDKYWIEWWPKFRDGKASLLLRSWSEVLAVVGAWLTEVKDNHDTPDLWAESAKARYVTDAAGDVGADNTPFTPEEIAALQSRLDEVEAYIESRESLDEPRKHIVQSRFRYLLGAAKRGLGRIDWLNIFVGQMFELFVNGVLKSSLYADVMRHAGTALGSVIKQLGAKLLGS
jgi:hypothetical protein